MQIKN